MELEELKQELRQEYWFMGLLGKSAPMQKLFEQIRNAAVSEAPVLICGESGTGKNLAAQAPFYYDATHPVPPRRDGSGVAEARQPLIDEAGCILLLLTDTSGG